MRVPLQKRVEIPAEVLFRELQGEVVILNMESERYYGLEDVGARMWQLLKDDDSVEDIIQQLETEYDVDPEQLRRDVAEFLAKLVEAGLVTAES